MGDSVQDLLTKDKLLARAMDVPFWSIAKSAHDFSTWAKEVDFLMNEGLTSLSTTLLVSGEKIPTYKNIGFLINGDLVDVKHVADTDSGSGGDFANGSFIANETDIYTLSELADRTRNEHLRGMNEVNVNVNSEDAFIGLFVNKTKSDMPKAQILLAQEYYKQQTGKTLPIYIYDSANGSLSSFNPSEKEKTDLINRLCEEKVIRSSSIYYEIYNADRQEEKQFDYLDRVKSPSSIERIASLRERIAHKNLPQEPKAPHAPKPELSKVDFNTLQMFKDKKVNG